jgi:putative ABC transport system ATP-binding protein
MTQSGQLLVLKGITKRYLPDEVPVLSGVDLTIAAGDRVAISGPSGSGKTTLLHIMGGLVTPDAGDVCIDGDRTPQGAEWDALRARAIGYAFQDAWLWPGLTASDNVELAMVGTETRRTARRERAEELLGGLGIAHRAHTQAAKLSGGERQRVALARALANHPRLLLADEPTGNLDADNTRQVIALIHEIAARDNTAVVIATHDTDVAATCRRHLAVAGGHVTEQATNRSSLRTSESGR